MRPWLLTKLYVWTCPIANTTTSQWDCMARKSPPAAILEVQSWRHSEEVLPTCMWAFRIPFIIFTWTTYVCFSIFVVQSTERVDGWLINEILRAVSSSIIIAFAGSSKLSSLFEFPTLTNILLVTCAHIHIFPLWCETYEIAPIIAYHFNKLVEEERHSHIGYDIIHKGVGWHWSSSWMDMGFKIFLLKF